MSPDYAPPTSSASSSQRPASAAPVQVANPNKRPRAEAGSGSDMSGGEMSDGSQRKRQKLKLRMSKSPERSPNGSRVVSPEVDAPRKVEGGKEKTNGAAPKGKNPSASRFSQVFWVKFHPRPPHSAFPNVLTHAV